MERNEIFFDMLQKQREYDEAVFRAHDTDYDKVQNEIPRALLDEIGELNHELKSLWCWWKFTIDPIDDAKVIEEFADVVHFCLMWINATPGKHTDYYIESCLSKASANFPYMSGMRDMLGGLLCSEPIRIIRAGMHMLDLSWDQVYDAYNAKHEINLNRVATGY